MRKLVLTILVVLQAAAAHAQSLSMYIGSAENLGEDFVRMDVQLIVCNNGGDTIYIKADNLDNLYPRVTNDVSEVMGNGSFLLVTGVKNLVTSVDRLLKMTAQERKKNPEHDVVQAEFKKHNYSLPHKEISGVKYYVFVPSKCLTIHCTTQSPTMECAKLADASEQEKENADVYFTIPVYYSTPQENTTRREVLVSRASDDLKKCVMAAATGKK